MIAENLQNKLREAGYKGEFDLSSLVEACGDRFSSLTRSPRNTWYVSWVENGSSVELVRDIEESTPEEAVANLWLELNKK